jgi:hypothetical protein
VAGSVLDRNAFPGHDAAPNCRTIRGSFAPNGASAISATSNKGSQGWWSVARTSQGLYTVTLDKGGPSIEWVEATLQLATAAARYIQVGAVDATARTVQIRVVDDSGAVQDVAADANNRINFAVEVRGSTTKV